jgi:hypothetical protein
MLEGRVWLPIVVRTPTLNNCWESYETHNTPCEQSTVDTYSHHRASRGLKCTWQPCGLSICRGVFVPIKKYYTLSEWFQVKASVDKSNIRRRSKRRTPSPYHFLSGTVSLFGIFTLLGKTEYAMQRLLPLHWRSSSDCACSAGRSMLRAYYSFQEIDYGRTNKSTYVI